MIGDQLALVGGVSADLGEFIEVLLALFHVGATVILMEIPCIAGSSGTGSGKFDRHAS